MIKKHNFRRDLITLGERKRVWDWSKTETRVGSVSNFIPTYFLVQGCFFSWILFSRIIKQIIKGGNRGDFQVYQRPRHCCSNKNSLEIGTARQRSDFRDGLENFIVTQSTLVQEKKRTIRFQTTNVLKRGRRCSVATFLTCDGNKKFN